MSWLLVVQPDIVQADVRKALCAEISERVVVAEDLEHALSRIDPEFGLRCLADDDHKGQPEPGARESV